MIDVEKNLWVWAVGGKFGWPQAILDDAETICEMIEDNPKVIFFYGPRLLAEMTWFTPCAYDERAVRMMNNLEV